MFVFTDFYATCAWEANSAGNIAARAPTIGALLATASHPRPDFTTQRYAPYEYPSHVRILDTRTPRLRSPLQHYTYRRSREHRQWTDPYT
jgi:hypothetical protein